MKKIITFLLLGLAVSAFAQITYNESDGPKEGTTLYSRDFQNLSLLNLDLLKESGGNKSWDVRGSYLNAGVTEYISSQNLYFKSHFPGANLASIDKPNPDSSYTMIEKNSNGIYLVGIKDTTTEVIFTPKIIFSPFPLTFGKNFQNDASADFMQDGLSFKYDLKSNATVDAWGTMTTNDGTFPVIKIKRIQITEISTSGFPVANSTEESHTWMTNGLGGPLVTLTSSETENPFGLFNDTTLTNIYKQEIVRNQEAQKSGLKLSITPNPVADQVSVQCQNINFNEATYSVINEEGKTVMNGNMKSNEILHLNVNQLAAGNYLVQILLDKKTVLFDILSKR